MWSDNETTDDLFGFRVHADLIRELILDPTVLPATIGIYGDWGGGKSSIMQMLKSDFEKGASQHESDSSPYSGIAVLCFNGWLLEGYDDAKAALLSSILTALRDHKRFGPKVKDSACSLLKRVNYMRGLRVLFSGSIAGSVAAVSGGVGLAGMLPAIALGAVTGARNSADDAAEKLVKNEEDTQQNEVLADIRQFREDFAAMLCKSDIKTLVVLIDDLDRCSPERIIENLEAIKLFLNVPNTAFVIGADRRIIRQAVSWRYRDALKAENSKADSSERLVDDYLEKLIQIPYRLPKLSPSEIETYLTLLFCRKHLGTVQYGKVCQAAHELRTKDRYCAFGQMQALEVLEPANMPQRLGEALRIGNGIALQITDVLQGNPRQVKRFLNAFFLRRKLADVAKLEHVEDDVLVKLMLLEYAESDLFEKFFADMSGETGLVKNLSELESKAAGKSNQLSTNADLPPEWGKLRRWLVMAPLLAELDLRDYMWVTRDRLGATMSGTRMIPTIVRSVMKQVLSDLADATGRKAISMLKPEERLILADELILHAHRKPEEMKAFQALVEIADMDDPIAEKFNKLLSQIPKGDLPAGLAVLIRSKAKKQNALGQVCQDIIKSNQEGKTRFEKALKQEGR